LLLTLLLSSFANAQQLFNNQKTSLNGHVNTTEYGLSAREAVAIASDMAQDSLPGSYLFQLYSKEAFWYDDYDTPVTTLWPAPTGRTSEWMTVYISENHEEAILIFVDPDGVVETIRMILSEIPEDELPPVSIESLPGLPSNFIDNIDALATSISMGMGSFIETARTYPGYEISYSAGPFWFLFPDHVDSNSDPFWAVELEFGEWNEAENRYAYTIVTSLINAVDGSFITMFVEEGFDSPEPFDFMGSSPADGEINVALNTTVSFTFNSTPWLPTFDYNETHPSPFYGVFPKNAITINEVQLAEDNETIRYLVEHQPDTDYTWILVAPGSHSGASLSRPEVITYSTAGSISGNTVAGQLNFRNTPYYFKKVGWPFESDKAISAYQNGIFNNVIVALVEPVMLEDFYGNLNDLPIRYAATPDPVTGEFTIPNVADGSYYLGAVMYNVQYGYPSLAGMGNYGTNDEPELVTVSGTSLEGLDFELKGYIPELMEPSDAQSSTLVASTYMAANHSEARLMALGTYESFYGTHAKTFQKLLPEHNQMRLPSDAADEFPTGMAYEWWFVYYDHDSESIHMITVFDNQIGDHETMLVSELDEDDLPGIPLTEMRTIPETFVNSTQVAELIRTDILNEILINAPDHLWIEVEYQLADLWWEFPDLANSETGLFWMVQIYAGYMNLFGTYIYHHFTILVDAQTGEIIGEYTETSTEKPEDLPAEIRLEQNFPNPFNPVTQIRYELPEMSMVKLQVFDITGRLVATLVDEQKSAGIHQQAFHSDGLASGIYVYRLQAGEQTITRKMTLIK
jgi:hypothetical protein